MKEQFEQRAPGDELAGLVAAAARWRFCISARSPEDSPHGWPRISNSTHTQGEIMFPTAYLRVSVSALDGVLIVLGAAGSQPPKTQTPAAEDERAALGKSLGFTEQLLARKIDEQMLFQALENVAVCDKVRYTGPPPRA